MTDLTHRVGRRGGVLLLFGLVWLTKAYSLFRGDSLTLVGQKHLLGAPLITWAVMWLVCGLIAIIFAFKPMGRDGIGYGAVVLPTWIWAIGYWQAWEQYGHGAWTTAIIWLAFSLVGLIAAGWQEAPTK